MKLPQPAAEEPQQNSPAELDPQQIALLDVLRRNGDGRASFAELRAAGIEFPASIVEELELLGLPLERSSVRRAGSIAPGVRLYEDARPGVAEPQADATRAFETSEAEPRGLRARDDRWVAPALLAAVLLAVVLTLGVIAAGSGRAHRATASRLAKRTPRSAATASHAPAAAHVSSAQRHHRPRKPAPAAPEARPPTALATELEARGHSLLESGQDGAAAARLSEAVAATGERTSDCIEPASETCLTYAYALYDLGMALAHEGRAAQATAVLEQRLRIDNQRAAVASELGQVRARTKPSASTPHRRHAHAGAGAGAAGATEAGGVAAPVA